MLQGFPCILRPKKPVARDPCRSEIPLVLGWFHGTFLQAFMVFGHHGGVMIPNVWNLHKLRRQTAK